jgi:hypothetical protein
MRLPDIHTALREAMASARATLEASGTLKPEPFTLARASQLSPERKTKNSSGARELNAFSAPLSAPNTMSPV